MNVTNKGSGRKLLAADVNWVTAGIVPPVRNQQQCGEADKRIGMSVRSVRPMRLFGAPWTVTNAQIHRPRSSCLCGD